MARVAGALFPVAAAVLPTDFSVYGGAASFEAALLYKKADNTEGIDDSAGIPVQVGDEFSVTLTNIGAAANGAVITNVSANGLYRQEDWGVSDYLIGKPTIGGTIRDPQSGDTQFEFTSITPGVFESFGMSWATDPNTGNAWLISEIVASSWGMEVESLVGSPASAYFLFSEWGIGVSYTPTTSIAYVDPPLLATGTAGQSITIKSDNFVGSSYLILIGGFAPTNIVRVDQFTITCDIPALGDGQHTIVVAALNGAGVPNGNVLSLSAEDGLEIGSDFSITGSGGVEVSGSADLELSGGALVITGSGGVEVSGSALLVLSVDISGIYELNPEETHDTLYARDSGEDTIEVAIPRPSVKFAYLGF